MSWTINCVKNTVKISKRCAKELFDLNEECGDDIWDDVEGVAYKGVLVFNSDHHEHQDLLAGDYGGGLGYLEILKKHKVKGDICWVDNEGDNKGVCWGYRFDGKGGMQELAGELVWPPKGGQ